MTVRRAFLLAAILTAGPLSACGQTPGWKSELDRQLPLLGHRNWIVVADSAYPWQTAPGIQTISTRQPQLDVLRTVLGAIDQAKHVRGTIFLDAELPYVQEDLAPGVDLYRAGLDQVLKGRRPRSLPHEQIIAQLDEAGKTFHILLLKTDLTLPYTSVFIRLDAGYWSDEAEQALRRSIPPAPQPQE